MLNMDGTHDIRNSLLHRHPSEPMTPLPGVGSRTASVTHSELDEMWHHNLDSAVLSPRSDVSATGEFEFIPHRQRPTDSPYSSTGSTAASVRSFLAEQRLAQLRAEHESERHKRRANVQAHMDRFAALQARRRQMEEEQSAAALMAAPKASPDSETAPSLSSQRRGSAFRTVIPSSESTEHISTRLEGSEPLDKGRRPSKENIDSGGQTPQGMRDNLDFGGLNNRRRSGEGIDAGGLNNRRRSGEGLDLEGLVNRRMNGENNAAANRTGGCSSGDSGVAPPPAHFKALTGSSQEGSDSGLDTTGLSEMSMVTYTPALQGVSAAQHKSASISMAGGSSSVGGGSSNSGTENPVSIPTTTVMGVWCKPGSNGIPRHPMPFSPPHTARSEASSVDDEVLRYYEAATHSGLPPGLLMSPPPPPVPEEEPLPPDQGLGGRRDRSDSDNSSMSAASRRYEARIRKGVPVPALRINVGTPDEEPAPKTPRDAIFGAGRSTRHSENVSRLRASFEAAVSAKDVNTASTHSLPAQCVSPRSSTGASPSWRSAAPYLGGNASMTSSAISSRTLSPGKSMETSQGSSSLLSRTLSPGRVMETSQTSSVPSEKSGRIATPVVRHPAPYRPNRDIPTALAGTARPGPNDKLDSHFRSPAPPGPLTELEQLFESLDLGADLLHRAERRELSAYLHDRVRNYEPARPAPPPVPPFNHKLFSSHDDARSIDDEVFENPLQSPQTSTARSMVVSPMQPNRQPPPTSGSSRTSSDHGSYMTPISSAMNTARSDRGMPDSARWIAENGGKSAAISHMMPSPTSADYLLPRPQRRKLEGFPDVRLDDMAWRKLQRDANSRTKAPEQPFVMRQRDFSSENDAGKRLGAFRPRRDVSNRSKSTERSLSPGRPHIIASDIPIDSSNPGRFISSTILRFDHTGISTVPPTTAFAPNGLFRPIAEPVVRRPPPPPPPRQAHAFATQKAHPPPRRHSGGHSMQSVDLARPLMELGQVGVQTIVPRKFLLHKAASHDDIYIETETPFAFNISATDRDIFISKVPSEEDMRQEREASYEPPPRPPVSIPAPSVASGSSTLGRRLSGGVPVTLRVVFGSDPSISQRFSVNSSQLATCDSQSQSALSQLGRSMPLTSSVHSGLSHHDSFRSVYHVDLGMA